MRATQEWLFSRKELELMTPSRLAGISAEREAEYRESNSFFLWQLGINCQYPIFPIATCLMFFNRFFTRRSFDAHDQSIVGLACLFLAGKVEECPKKLLEVIQQFHKLKNPGAPPISEGSKEASELREAVLIHERIVLKTLSFNISVTHPYKYLTSTVRRLDELTHGSKESEVTYGKDSKLSTSAISLCETAWKFANDSLRTTLALQYDAETLAVGIIDMSIKFLRLDISSVWYREVSDANVTPHILTEICVQILGVYEKMTAERPVKLNEPIAALTKGAGTKVTQGATAPKPNHNCPKIGSTWTDRIEYEFEGSAARKYILRKDGEVYRCSCSVWRRIDSGVARRTCRHLIVTRGERTEKERVGEESFQKLMDALAPKRIFPTLYAPPMLKRKSPTTTENLKKKSRE